MNAYRAKTKPWYGTARWKALRSQQLGKQPRCEMCLAIGVITPATVADHVEPHKGDEDKFWNGALQSLCKRHHDSDKAMLESGKAPRPTIGTDGWPVHAH